MSPTQVRQHPTVREVPLHRTTPLIGADIGGHHVALKLENLQAARSFKIRGIGHLCQHHRRQGATALVCSSAGNAGYAVAWAGRELGLPVTVVLPAGSSPWMRQRIGALGATVQVHGQVWDDANARALALARAPGVACVPPFDDPLIWQGHATLVDELARQCPRPPGAIVLAVGGGGLLLGVLQGLARHRWHDTRVIAVEPEGAASLATSLMHGRVTDLPNPRSVATSLCVRRISEAVLPACRAHPVTPICVSDDACQMACMELARHQGMVVEPACGAALAPLHEHHPALADQGDIVVIVCGGQVVTLEQLAAWSGHARAA